jgi:cell division protein FtsW (lipid II flippase)
MNRKFLVRLLLVIWLLLFAGSLIVPYFTGTTGDGLTRGLNRIAIFLQFQIAAAFVAMVIWWLGLVFEKKTAARWLSRTPALLAFALFLFIAGLLAYANYSKPRPQTAPGTITPPTQNMPTQLPGR